MDLNEIYVNSAQLELLTGQEICIGSVLKRPELLRFEKLFSEKQITEKELRAELVKIKIEIEKMRGPKATLQEIKNSGLLKKTECFDSRYDKLDAIDMAISIVQEKGLNRDIKEKILTNTPCIKKVELVGLFSFLADIIREDELQLIIKRLGESQAYLIKLGKIKKTECMVYNLETGKIHAKAS